MRHNLTVRARVFGIDCLTIDGTEYPIVDGHIVIPPSDADRLRALGLILVPLVTVS